MSSSTSAIFTGTSRFAGDLQQVVTRAVNIASLPITQLNSQQTLLNAKASALSSLDTKFAALKSAIQSLRNSTGASSLNSSVGDLSIAHTTISGEAIPGTYSLEVTTLGSYSNTLSLPSLTRVSDPSIQSISPSAAYTLTVDGTATTLSPKDNSLNGLVNAINSQPGVKAQASLVNIGSSATPDYRLTVQAGNLGAVNLQLNDGTSDLLNSVNTGALAGYKVNGLTTPISSDSRSVTLAPGISVTLLGQSSPGVSTTISVTRGTSATANALSSFVSSYNQAIDELAKHRGQVGGALQGNNIIFDLSNSIRQLGGYSSGNTGIASLSALGVTYDSSGHLAFDSSLFSTAAQQPTQLSNFLGSATSGGFLQQAANVLASIEDSTTGIIATHSLSVQSEISHNQTLIDRNQARVTLLQTSLQKRIAKSDALVSALEQSYSVLSGVFQAQQYNALQKQL